MIKTIPSAARPQTANVHAVEGNAKPERQGLVLTASLSVWPQLIAFEHPDMKVRILSIQHYLHHDSITVAAELP